MDSSLSTCTKVVYCYSMIISFVFSGITSFPHWSWASEGDTDMVEFYYHVVPYLQCCYALLATGNAAHDWYIRTLSGAVRPRDCLYISVKPLADVLHYIVSLLSGIYCICIPAFPFICPRKVIHMYIMSC